MYSQQDLNSAVEAGVITRDAADALRMHVASQRDAVPADAEHFRLITGFNDIFVTIGVVILLVAVAAIGDAVWSNDDGPSPASGLFVAGTAWMLAEFFTAKRRMALPSIILLLAFIGGVFFGLLGFAVTVIEGDGTNDVVGALLVAASALVTAGAAWLHWRRFMVPITVAAGTAAIAATLIALVIAAIGPTNVANVETLILSLIFVAGLAIFAFAMRWDISDPTRETRRSDVAFWLHLLAAPMLAHPLFSLFGVTDGGALTVAAAFGVLAVYLFFAVIAIAVDRRALLVSALAYVLVALTWLFREFGAVELNFALTAFVIGSALLTLSALWTPIRASVVNRLPGTVQGKLPATALA